MRRPLRLGALLSAVILVATGCATKNWVNEHFGKKQAEIEQRQADTNQRVSEVDARLNETSQRVTETGELAKQAHTRADDAYGRADDVNSRLTRLWSNRLKRNLVETVQVEFGFDRSDLTDGAQTTLLGVVKELAANDQLTVDLEGFTDQVGTRDYNLALSQRRVEAVRRFLLQNGTELPRVHAIGLGMVEGEGKSEDPAKQRRVTLRLMVAAD